MLNTHPSNLFSQFDDITHLFTTRDGGISPHPYSSLNLAFHVNDKEECVLNNHTLLANTLEYDRKNLIHMKQVHSNKVHIVKKTDNFNTVPICDALITNQKSTPLMVMVADCSPILFYDNVQKVIAVAHAGRQGAFLNIVHNVITSFEDNFQSIAKNIYVSIGAAICQECYEVNEQIAQEAQELKLEFAIKKESNKYYLDIRKILKKQLLDSGIQKNNIEISNECSSCLKEKYFSYRVSGATGRFAGVIKLN